VLIHDSSIDKSKLKLGFNILKQIIIAETNSNDSKTLIIIWNMLPTYLGSFCCIEDSKVIGSNKNTFIQFKLLN